MSSKGQSIIAASFEYLKGIINPASLGYVPSKRATLLSAQKFRNNYAAMEFREQAATCRMAAEVNWFLRPVVDLRAAVHAAGFGIVGLQEGSEAPRYDFAALVDDLIQEDLVTSNLICLWRKGEDMPQVSVLDAERCMYRAAGGVETLHLSLPADALMKGASPELKALYREQLGARMFEAMCNGRGITIIKGKDAEWNFAVLAGGKRRGGLTTPQLVSVLDDIDQMELAKVGDWNLLWKRKEVIRFWKKGYAVKSGGGAGIESVNISKAHIKQLGEGAKEINGPSDIPVNHDVETSYLTIGPEQLEAKHLEGIIDRLLHFGGPEAVALFGSFSQQNGAAPSLMRNARVRASVARSRVERMLGMLLTEPEFSSFGIRSAADLRVRWSQRPLHSIDELTKLVKETAGGVASPQTRREMLDLDDAFETERMKSAAGDWEGYVPVFEASQGLLREARPEIYRGQPAAQANPSPPGDPGRPGGDSSPA